MSYPYDCFAKIEDFCTLGLESEASNQKSKILFAGDSFLAQLSPFINILGKYEKWNGDMVTVGGCPFIFNYKNEKYKLGNDCINMNEFLFKEYSDYDIIVLANSYSNELFENKDFIDSYEKTLKKLISEKKKIYIINSSVSFEYNLARAYMLENKLNIKMNENLRGIDYQKSINNWSNLKKHLFNKYPEINIIDLSSYIDKNNGFIEQMPLLSDNGHWNIFASKKIAELFIKDGKKLLKKEDVFKNTTPQSE